MDVDTQVLIEGLKKQLADEIVAKHTYAAMLVKAQNDLAAAQKEEEKGGKDGKQNK